jgi:hypothetical protein
MAIIAAKIVIAILAQLTSIQMNTIINTANNNRTNMFSFFPPLLFAFGGTGSTAQDATVITGRSPFYSKSAVGQILFIFKLIIL